MTDDNARALVTEKQDVTSFPKLLLRAAAQLFFTFAIWGGLLFGAAGNIAWLQGWPHMGLWLVTFRQSEIIVSSPPAPTPSSDTQCIWE